MSLKKRDDDLEQIAADELLEMRNRLGPPRESWIKVISPLPGREDPQETGGITALGIYESFLTLGTHQRSTALLDVTTATLHLAQSEGQSGDEKTGHYTGVMPRFLISNLCTVLLSLDFFQLPDYHEYTGGVTDIGVFYILMVQRGEEIKFAASEGRPSVALWAGTQLFDSLLSSAEWYEIQKGKRRSISWEKIVKRR